MEKTTLEYFVGPCSTNSLAITSLSAGALELCITSWPESASASKTWIESRVKPGTTAEHLISRLSPKSDHTVRVCGRSIELKAEAEQGFVRVAPENGKRSLVGDPLSQ